MTIYIAPFWAGFVTGVLVTSAVVILLLCIMARRIGGDVGRR